MLLQWFDHLSSLVVTIYCSSVSFRENSQSSTDTALSSNDATTPTHNSHGEVKVKSEPVDTAENGELIVKFAKLK